VDHVQSKGHVTGTCVTWDFRGGGRTTCQGKSRGDGWDRYREPGSLLSEHSLQKRLSQIRLGSVSWTAILHIDLVPIS